MLSSTAASRISGFLAKTVKNYVLFSCVLFDVIIIIIIMDLAIWVHEKIRL